MSDLMRRQGEEEVLMARLLEKALRRSNAVDREALCIVAGQKVRFSSPFLPLPSSPLPSSRHILAHLLGLLPL